MMNVETQVHGMTKLQITYVDFVTPSLGYPFTTVSFVGANAEGKCSMTFFVPLGTRLAEGTLDWCKQVASVASVDVSNIEVPF
jgi:hypothetical protein